MEMKFIGLVAIAAILAIVVGWVLRMLEENFVLGATVVFVMVVAAALAFLSRYPLVLV
jgi:hypothetical protein